MEKLVKQLLETGALIVPFKDGISLPLENGVTFSLEELEAGIKAGIEAEMEKRGFKPASFGDKFEPASFTDKFAPSVN